jgi:hypothetical protein
VNTSLENDTMGSTEARALLRHALATIAYRGGKTLAGAPPEFAAFRVSPGSRTPAEILAHLADLFDWAASMAVGRPAWQISEPLSWDAQVARFFEALRQFDTALSAGAPLACPPEKLLQAPIADALTHVGQLAMIRRLAGSAVRGEDYFSADISVGRVGPSQAPPQFEFD